jgi:hypothetical protein
MPDYPVDPGHIFASDVHRRVTAFLPLPDEDPMLPEEILSRLNKDPHTPVDDVGELNSILADLEASGDAVKKSDMYRRTKAGDKKLHGPALTDQTIDDDGEVIWVEPPPMEGERLKAAEAKNEAEQEEARELEKTENEKLSDELKEQLKETEAAIKEAG